MFCKCSRNDFTVLGVAFLNPQDHAKAAIARSHRTKSGFIGLNVNARWPVSRVLSRRRSGMDGHSSGTPVAGRLAQPTRTTARKPAWSPDFSRDPPSLLGFAPGGVCPAAPVARGAVRSYRTLSSLPASGRSRRGRFAFCGTFPRLAPAGGYPAPCFRGARTFLPRPGLHPGKGGHPAIWRVVARRLRAGRQ